MTPLLRPMLTHAGGTIKYLLNRSARAPAARGTVALLADVGSDLQSITGSRCPHSFEPTPFAAAPDGEREEPAHDTHCVRPSLVLFACGPGAPKAMMDVARRPVIRSPSCLICADTHGANGSRSRTSRTTRKDPRS